jgi:hypothetical protein
MKKISRPTKSASLVSFSLELFLKYEKWQVGCNERYKKQQSQEPNSFCNSEHIKHCKNHNSSQVSHNFHYVASERVDIDDHHY